MTKLEKLAQLVRYNILISTTSAGSGHPTSSLSATDIMTTLFFGGFLKYDLKRPKFHNNDRVIFSKGHASPLLYSLYGVAGVLSEQELKNLRKFSSRLEGHPTMRFEHTEAATGSLGQGLSIGVGMAMNARYIDELPYTTYVLLGDSEMAEGSVWEAIELASYYKLGNLVGIIDVNRLGQRGQTMLGYNVREYEKRIKAFGWKTITIDGHSISACKKAFTTARKSKNQPVMIIAKTIKGKGISFLENKPGWHGKTLSMEQHEKALKELGSVDTSLHGRIALPKSAKAKMKKGKAFSVQYKKSEMVATRKAYGNAIARIAGKRPDVVVLDAEVSNSTYAEEVKESAPDRFFEMFIAEQNMVGTALGMSRRGKKPFVSTFAAFFTRAFDQIRMSQYSDPNIVFVGSHAGVSIGEDGSSQMGLEDIAMFRAVHESVVLYPSDAHATEKLMDEVSRHTGLSYIRTTRAATPMIYQKSEPFFIGGSKVLYKHPKDEVTVIAAGITVHEALKAYDELLKDDIRIRVIDAYSIKPLDVFAVRAAAKATHALITVEDHYPEGGLGEAVASAVAGMDIFLHHMAVRKMPRSGTPEQLLQYERISSSAIVQKVKQMMR